MASERSACRRVVYHGRVQGVGFRATARSIARRYPVAGFVRNRTDGTVELQAAGEPAVLDQFLAEIASRFEGMISHAETEDAVADLHWTAFEIRR